LGASRETDVFEMDVTEQVEGVEAWVGGKGGLAKTLCTKSETLIVNNRVTWACSETVNF
jgi:hypothetical protein